MSNPLKLASKNKGFCLSFCDVEEGELEQADIHTISNRLLNSIFINDLRQLVLVLSLVRNTTRERLSLYLLKI